MSNHFGTTPTDCANLILAAFRTAEFLNGGAAGGGTGIIKSIGRIEDDADLAQINRAILPGLPGLVLVYGGGEYKPETTNRQGFEDMMRFRILAIAGDFSDRGDRFAEEEPDILLSETPGVEELQDFGLYLACRALRVGGVRMVRPVRHDQAFKIGVNKWVGTVDIECERRLNIYDEATGNTFQRLGICHNFKDADELFLLDNTTPNSDEPRGVDGGVADLT